MTTTRRLVSTAVLLLCAGCASAPSAKGSPPSAGPDPTSTDPDKYRVVLENEHVRVLRYHDAPGTKTHAHRHPDSLLVALSSFQRRLAFPDGRTKDLDLAAGTAMWVPAQTHVGENVGTTETDVLLVEVKHGP